MGLYSVNVWWITYDLPQHCRQSKKVNAVMELEMTAETLIREKCCFRK